MRGGRASLSFLGVQQRRQLVIVQDHSICPPACSWCKCEMAALQVTCSLSTPPPSSAA